MYLLLHHLACSFKEKEQRLVDSESFTFIGVQHDFHIRSHQTKDYEIGICCFSAKHNLLRSKSKDWLSLNQNNVSEWGR